MLSRHALIFCIAIVVLACASAVASGPPRAAEAEVPVEVYLAVLEAAAERLAPQVDGTLYVESERIPAHVPTERVHEAGFELRSGCDPGPRHFSPGGAVSPTEGIWIVDAIYSSRGGGTGHTEQYLVQCDGGRCSARGGLGVQALVVYGAACPPVETDRPAPPPLRETAGCGGVAGEVGAAGDPGVMLRGAQVMLVGTPAGAIADPDGRFSLTAGRLPDAGFTGELRAQRFGYQSVGVPISVHPDSATIVRIGLPKSMPRPEWQREPEVEVEVKSCRAG